MGNPFVFIILAIIAIAAATGMLLSRNAVHSALYLVLNFMTIAVFYLTLNAPFVAMVQVTVYAGAIIILFLFVIMLLGAEQLRGIAVEQRGERWHRLLAMVLAVALIGVFVYLIIIEGAPIGGEIPLIDSSPTELGLLLFENYLLPFEITGLLLLAAMIGVAVLGHSKEESDNA
ncbi:MAG: NADH-quinone oxidoreductase subunit J [Candidatus Promineifilaceae bacterium]